MHHPYSYGISTPILRWTSLKTELLWIYDGPVAPQSRCHPADHRHGYWVWLLRKGKVQVRFEGGTIQAKSGQWMISPMGMIEQKFSSDAEILSLHFQCCWPTGENLFVETKGLVFEAAKFPRLQRSGSRLERLVSQHVPDAWIEFLNQSLDYPVFLKIQQRFLEWLINFFDAMIEQHRTLSGVGGGDERLWRAAECLHSAPLDENFPADQLQKETSLGRAQLDRLFWKAFGLTTRGYWEKLREDSATNSLQTTMMSIKEIAYRLGFKQPSHFTKWFSMRLDITPQDYRNRMQAAK